MIGRARYADSPRGDIIGDSTGFLKLLFHQDDLRLLGVHVLGEQATELVHIGLFAMRPTQRPNCSVTVASTIQR